MLRTALVIDGNTDGGQAALRELDAAIERTGAEVEKAGVQGVKASVGLERLRQAEEAAAKAGLDLTESQRRLAIQGRLNTDIFAKSTVSMDRVTASAGAQRAGMQQLGMQLGDMMTMYQLGARPQQIFASQMGQTLQAVQLMTGGTSKLAGFLGGPWGIAISVAAMALTPLIGKLFETVDALGDVEQASKDAMAAFFDSLPQASKLSDVMTQSSKTVFQATVEMAKWQAIADKETGSAAYKANTYAAQQVRAMRAKIEAERDGVESAIKLNRIYADKAAAEDKAATGTRAHTAAISAEQKAFDAALKSGNDYISNLELEVAKLGLSEKALRQLEIQRAKDAAATDEQRKRIEELNRAREDGLALEAAKKTAQGLADDTANMGLTPAQAKEREAIAAATAAADAALMASTEEARKALLDQSKAITDNLAKWKARADFLETQKIEGDIVRAKAETDLEAKLGAARIAALKGLHGEPLEDELARINHEREISIIRLTAEAEAAALNAQGLHDAAAARLRLGEAEVKASNQAFDFEKQEVDIDRSNQRLEEMIDLLQQIGGMGKVVGGALAVLSGNFGALGNSGLGGVLRVVLETKDKDGRRFGDELSGILNDLFKDVFGKNGIFGQTLQSVLQGAGQGMAAADAIFGGSMRTAGKIGSAIGGAAGKALGSMLGPVGAALGSVIGGIIGGAIGNAIAGSKKGGVTLDGSGITGTNFKNQERIEAATKSADGIIDSLGRIADALGGTVGAVAGVSIGMRNDKWKVDPTGQGRVKGSGVIDFGDDAEAAAMYAMKLLIQRGVIGGIRASTQNILQAGKDLETQLNKAVAWEGVLKEAESAGSSFAKELADLKKAFEEIGKIAIEAKASTEELAKVQELLIRKEQELIDQAMSSYRSTFYTDAENLAYAKKQISATLTPLGYGSVDTVDEYKKLVAATDPLKDPELFGALMELSDEFGILKDAADSAADAAADAAAQEKALAQQRDQIVIETLRAQGKETEALAKERQMQLAAADAKLKPYLQDLFKAQDIQAARDNLREAFDKAKAPLEDTIERFGRLGDSLRDVRQGLDADGSGKLGFAEAQAKLRATAYKANVLHDEEALGQLGGVIGSFVSSAKSGLGSQLELDRAMAEARRIANSGILTADSAVDVAKEQLEAMTDQVGQLIDLNETALSIHDAIVALQQATGGGSNSPGPSPAQQAATAEQNHAEIRDRFDQMLGRFREWGDRQGRLQRLIERVIVDDQVQVGP